MRRKSAKSIRKSTTKKRKHQESWVVECVLAARLRNGGHLGRPVTLFGDDFEYFVSWDGGNLRRRFSGIAMRLTLFKLMSASRLVFEGDNMETPELHASPVWVQDQREAFLTLAEPELPDLDASEAETLSQLPESCMLVNSPSRATSPSHSESSESSLFSRDLSPVDHFPKLAHSSSYPPSSETSGLFSTDLLYPPSEHILPLKPLPRSFTFTPQCLLHNSDIAIALIYRSLHTPQCTPFVTSTSLGCLEILSAKRQPSFRFPHRLPILDSLVPLLLTRQVRLISSVGTGPFFSSSCKDVYSSFMGFCIRECLGGNVSLTDAKRRSEAFLLEKTTKHLSQIVLDMYETSQPCTVLTCEFDESLPELLETEDVNAFRSTIDDCLPTPTLGTLWSGPYVPPPLPPSPLSPLANQKDDSWVLHIQGHTQHHCI
ncbi:hypothetical protein DL96DRAFT_1702387 [Flagelloscypha sp. PMI_526]|nr:hypothetical protein DL96DRAFT_1702387 [Flagelloscypha sp. PMI_526]